MTNSEILVNGLARDLRVPVTRMSEIVNGRHSITADTALRLARYFAMTPQFWMNLQAVYDLEVATVSLLTESSETCIHGTLRRTPNYRLPRTDAGGRLRARLGRELDAVRLQASG